jgi:hypothetical protein
MPGLEVISEFLLLRSKANPGWVQPLAGLTLTGQTSIRVYFLRPTVNVEYKAQYSLHVVKCGYKLNKLFELFLHIRAGEVCCSSSVLTNQLNNICLG